METSPPLTSPPTPSGSILAPKGSSNLLGFLNTSNGNNVESLKKKGTFPNPTSLADNKLDFFYKKTSKIRVPITVEKGNEQKDISALEPLSDASTNFIALTTDFPSVLTYDTLENEIATIQALI